MRFDELIEGLGRKLGIDLSVDEAGACVLSVDGMTVTLQDLPERESAGFWGEIGEPPPEGLENLLTSLLEANHLFRGTGGATISRDPDSGVFYLCRILDIRCMDVETMSAELEKFVNTLESWVCLVKDYRGAVNSSSSPEAKADYVPQFGERGFLSV